MPSSKRTAEADDERGASKLTWLAPLVLIAVLVGLYFVWPGYRSLLREAYEVLASEDQARIEAWVRGFDPWGWVVLLGLMVLQTVIAILPSVAAMAASVLAYGPLRGGALAWGGMMLAASVAYGIGRALGPVTVDRLIGGRSRRKLEEVVERYGFWAIVVARLSPVLSTDAVSIVGGLAGMGFWRFLAATGAGALPLVVAIAALGAEVERLEIGLLAISAASLVIFVGYVVFDRRRRRAAGGGTKG